MTNPENTRTSRDHLEELLADAQKAWDQILDPATGGTDHRAILSALASFSAAWYLRALREAAPEKAEEVAAELSEILDDGGSAGEWIWQMRHDLGQVQA